MIYDHSLVHGWRTRIEKEELAARDTLRKFMGQRTDPSGATGLLGNSTNNLEYNERNGPWGNGGNFSEAKFDQPFSDLQDKRVKENIRVWDKGFRPKAFKAISPAKQTAALKKKQMEDKLKAAEQEGHKEEDSGLISARTNLSIPGTPLLRISPLTEPVPEPHVKGCKRSWAFLENNPVKIQLRQEEELHKSGTLENRTMNKLNPLMKSRPKTATPKLPSSRKFWGAGGWKSSNQVAAEAIYGRNWGQLGEDGAAGDVRLGWISQNMLNPQQYADPKSSRRTTRRSKSSYGTRPTVRPPSRCSSVSSGGGRRRQELEALISRVRAMEEEIEDVQDARVEVEKELARTRSLIATDSAEIA